MAVKEKNKAAVTLGRAGGKKGGPARAAKLTAEERSASARRAVEARWAKDKQGTGHSVANRADEVAINRHQNQTPSAPIANQFSDQVLLSLLKRIKEASGPVEIGRLTDQLERVIFHKQFENAKLS